MSKAASTATVTAPSMGSERYAGTSVALGVDPMVAGTQLLADLGGPYVLYERHGQVCVGSGAVAELLLNRHEVRWRVRDEWRVVPVGDDPMQQVAELLADCGVADWRAYGWFAFELSYLLHGMPEAAGEATLAHLIVPMREARLAGDTAELRAVEISELAELCARVRLLRSPDREAATRTMADEMIDYDSYRRTVLAAVDDIQAHRLQKVILSRVVPVSAAIDLAATYRTGRRGNTPARSFLLDLGGLRATGFSPETVVEVDASGRVSTQPLAGTRALSGDSGRDDALRTELLNDPKEVFEHAVSVRGAQQELREICRDGSVRVDEFMTVSRRGSVQHLASRVSGQLAGGRNGWHALTALFPAVTASGLPKPAACAAIHRYESQPRDLYGGAVVVVDADGSLDAALVLRTVFQRDGRTWLRAGAGVVEQSTPEREFEETREKLRSISRFLVPATEQVSIEDVVIAP